MKATTLTCSTFEMMYYETRGVYCNPAERFLNYTEFKKIFEPALFGGCNINELATAIYNKAIDNGATEEAALHAALFVFSFTAGKQAARKWFDGLVTKQPENDNPDDNTDNSNPDDNTDNSNPDDNTDNSNPDDNTDNSNPDDNTDNSNPDDNTDNSNPDDNTDDNTDNSNPDDNTDNSNPDDNTDNSNPDDNTDNSNPEVEEELKLFGRDLKVYLNTYTMFDATKDGAFMPIINGYRINCINHIHKLKQHIGKENIKLADAIINALKDAENGVIALFDLYICFDESGFNVMNKEHCTKALEFLKDYLPKPKPEEDPKDPDPTGPSDSGVTIDPAEEIFEPIEVANVSSSLETIATSNGGTPIPDVEEACLFNGKEFSDNDLVTILKNKITVLEGRNVSRNSINMLLNLVMNNQDGFVTKLISLGAKIPPEIKEVKATKYTIDKKRFDTVFEVATNTDEPIVVFYHWDPIPNEEGTAWTYDALVLPFSKVTLTKDAKTKKAKADKRQKTKKQTEQPAAEVQAMTATA